MNEQYPGSNVAVSLSMERPNGLPLSLALDPMVTPDGAYTLNLAELVKFARGMRETVGNPTGIVQVVIAPYQEQTPIYRFADNRVSVDTEQHVVYADGEPLKLSPRPFSVLALLASRAGTIVSRNTLLEQVWGTSEGRTKLHIAVSKMRGKLGPNLSASIKTEPGVGYMALRSLKNTQKTDPKQEPGAS